MNQPFQKKIRIAVDNINLDKYINRKSVFIIIALSVFFILIDKIIQFYDKNIVSKILSQISSTHLLAILICLLCIFSLLISYNAFITNKKLSNSLFTLITSIFILFLFARFSSKYIYLPYSTNGVKYVDFIFIIFESFILLKINNWVNIDQPPKFQSRPFLIDAPLLNSEADLYNRKTFAKELAIKIKSKVESSNAGSLAIGITGEWGSGKTSFCNFIKEDLKDKNRIVIDFTPWRSSSPSKIIEDFFELLINVIKKFDPSLSNEISKYAKSLVKIDENSVTKSIETLSDFLFNGTNKNENYELINRSIQKCKKQIIIFIDDLDRLDKKEIIEVLRIIRNTANFNNIVYAVSYDKQYVLEAVKEFNKHNYRNFLEKIFQFEFLLPNYNSAILKNQIKNILKKSVIVENSLIDAAVDFSGISGRSITSTILKTQRDVIRFSNSIIFEIEKVKNEVNFIDFYFIQLLKVKYPTIYKSLSDHIDLFFITEEKKFRFRNLDEKNYDDSFLTNLKLVDNHRKDSVESEGKKTIFEEYISRNDFHALLSEIDKDIVIEIVQQLLKEKFLRQASSSIDYKSFVYTPNIHKYFNIQLLETDFPASEFENVRFGNYENYKTKIFEWIKNGRLSDILERLEKITDFDGKQEWENQLKILIAIGKYQLAKNGPYGINYKQIIEILNYPKQNNVIKFFEAEDQYLKFVKEFFTQAPDPYVFESSILAAALTPVVSLHLSDEEINKQLLKYLQDYCENHNEVTLDFRELHRNCVAKRDKFGYQFDYIPEAQELFKSYFLKYLKGSELNSFIQQTDPEKESFHIIQDWFNVFFSNWEDFEKYLYNADNLKIEENFYNEFISFYKNYKAENYNPVEFQFEYLKPNRWTNQHG